MSAPSLPELFVISGLVGGHPAPRPVPIPPRDLAQLQLKAIDHRFMHAGITGCGAAIEKLTHDDFRYTRADGAWLPRAAVVAQVCAQQAPRNAHSEDVRVRLFGPVAVVHAVFVALRDNAAPTRLRTTDAYVWHGSAWRLVSAQETALGATATVPLVTGTAPAIARRPSADPAGDDSSVLHALNDEYVRAFRSADVAWYDAHLAPDYLATQSDGSLHDRGAALKRFALTTFADTMASFPVDRVTVRRFADVALIHAENAYELRDGRRGTSRYTDIWHKRSGRWLCIAAHITPHTRPSTG